MDEQAFIAEVLAAPDDDAPRLVWADWLEEHGDPRSALIRTQCELARTPARTVRRFDLEQIEGHLLRDHYDAWVRPLSQFGAYQIKLWRGFVDALQIRGSDLAAHAAEIFDAAPLLRSLKLIDASAQMEHIAALPQLEQIEQLDFSFNRLGDGPVLLLTESRHITRLRKLILRGNGLTERGVLHLSSTLRVAKLVALDLSFNRFGDPGASYLLYSPALHSLQSLDVRNTDISPHMRLELVKRFGSQVEG